MRKILLPFYSVKEDKLIYLNKYELCRLPQEKELREDFLIREGALVEEHLLSKKKDDILVIEPHLDDFALSALSYAIDDYNILVLNIFSRMNVDSFTWQDKIKITESEYEKLRIEESNIAVKKILGQKFISLKEKSTRITQKNSDELSKVIVDNVKNILGKYNVNKIMLPMGVGNHPDHIITYSSLIDFLLSEEKCEVILYPEYPYSRCKKSYNDRICELKKQFKLKPIFIGVEEKINIILDVISSYRSQHDDINRDQMLAIIREDYKAIATEYNCSTMSSVYYKIER